MTDTEAQVVAQCRAVAHLATALASIHQDYISIADADGLGQITEIVGERTAAFMETLGDMLNAMDAATEEDDWMAPVFAEAHRRWPQEHGQPPSADAVDPSAADSGTPSTRD